MLHPLMYSSHAIHIIYESQISCPYIVLNLSHTHTHTHTGVCVCVCVCVNKYTYGHDFTITYFVQRMHKSNES